MTVSLLDGGLSTALEELGANLNTSLWSGELLRTNRNLVRKAHQSFVDAGAEVLISSSYQISYPGCAARGWSREEVSEALTASTELARFDGVKVAASVGPYGAFLADGSEYRGNYGLDLEELKDFHRERLYRLIASNPDYLAVETIPELTEARAIIELLHESELKIPFWISFSCRNETQISSGESFAQAAALVADLTHSIGLGINCTSPQFVTPLMNSLSEKARFILYPNSGREWDAVHKKWLGDQSSAFSGDQISEWIEAGASIIGGCCGVGPSDIAELSDFISQ